MPVPCRTGPTKRQQTVNEFSNATLGAVTEGRDIRNHAHVPEQQRNGRVSRNSKHVPQQRATEVRPHRQVLRWDREQPVKHPNATNVNAGEHARTDNSENCHRFSGAVDTGSPVLAEQKQDRRNQCSGVTDTDPEHEVHNRPAPVGRVVVTPDTDARHQQVINQAAKYPQQTHRQQQ